MTAVALAAEPAARRRHASREEYFTWLDTVFNAGIRARGQARIPANPYTTDIQVLAIAAMCTPCAVLRCRLSRSPRTVSTKY